MIFIIDAYNVLKQVEKSNYLDENTLEKFIKKIMNFVDKNHHKIELVFDGQDFLSKNMSNKHVNIKFSGFKYSADDYILNFIEQNRSNNIVVVSSDRVIKLFAKKINIKTIDSLVFYDYLLQSIKSDNKINIIKSNDKIKKIILEKSDLDNLMEAACKKILIKDTDITDNNNPKLKDLFCNLKKVRKKNE